MKLHFYAATTLCLCVALVQTAGQAQQDPAFFPLEPADTSSPRATLNSFIDACNELYNLASQQGTSTDFATTFLPTTERILDCLDLSGLPPELSETVGVESAVYLKEVLDRVALPPDAEIPVPGETADSPALTRWQIPHTRIEIVLVTEGSRQGQYLFSVDTVRRAARFYSAAKQLPYRSDGPVISLGFQERYAALTKRQPTLASDTSSPRGTLTLFLNTMDEVDEIIRSNRYIHRTGPELQAKAMQIMSCLDLSELPDYAREEYAIEAAVCLKEILDRIPVPPVEEIPGPENIEGVATGEQVLRWQIPNSRITIAKVIEGEHRGAYLFSSATVSRAAALYEEIKEQPYRTEGRPVSEGLHDWWLTAPGDPNMAVWVEQLPDWFRHRVFELAVWQWTGLLLAMCAGLGLMAIVYRIGRIRSGRIRERGALRYWGTLVFAVVAMLVPLAFKYVVWEYLTIRGSTLYIVNFIADLVFLLSLIVVIIAITNRLADSVVAVRTVQADGLDASLIRILCRMLGIIAAIVVFLEGGRYLGFPLATLLASAGIGGLAIALSAQGMIKGLFGTVMILLDKPYRVGERIVAKGQDGVVEEIGLRSTKLRAFLTNHVVSIPNDQMADAEIENIGKRKHIRRMSNIHIPLDTSMEKVERAVAAVRAALADHEGMDPEFPPQVYFNEFNPDSFNIQIIYWYTPPDLWSYYAACEKLNFDIFRAFEEYGVQFSLPVRHSYWKEDSRQGPLEINVVNEQARSDKSDSQPTGSTFPNAE